MNPSPPQISQVSSDQLSVSSANRLASVVSICGMFAENRSRRLDAETPSRRPATPRETLCCGEAAGVKEPLWEALEINLCRYISASSRQPKEPQLGGSIFALALQVPGVNHHACYAHGCDSYCRNDYIKRAHIVSLLLADPQAFQRTFWLR